MKRERFDYICSLGSSCLCATALREAGLRLSSGPFDWLMGTSLPFRADLIAHDFVGWLEVDDFERIAGDGHFTTIPYRNRKTGFKHIHDFAQGRPFAETYPEVREKYRRRIARFFAQVRSSRRVLFVWVENPVENERLSDADIVRARETLTEKFPGVGIEFLVIDRAANGVERGRLGRTAYGWRVSCDYRRKAAPGEGAVTRPWDIDTRPILAVLANFETSDYRDTALRGRYAASRREAAFALYGARTVFGYAVARLKVKVCKLLLNRLRRKGADMRRLFECQLGGVR